MYCKSDYDKIKVWYPLRWPAVLLWKEFPATLLCENRLNFDSIVSPHRDTVLYFLSPCVCVWVCVCVYTLACVQVWIRGQQRTSCTTHSLSYFWDRLFYFTLVTGKALGSACFCPFSIKVTGMLHNTRFYLWVLCLPYDGFIHGAIYPLSSTVFY